MKANASLMEISLPIVDENGEESKTGQGTKGHITVCGDTHGQYVNHD